MNGKIYEGLQNRFIITEEKYTDYPLLAIRNCNEYNVDGLIHYDKENNKMTIYNKDGTKASMCGNGIRCLSNYLYFKNKEKKFSILTDDGNKQVEIINDKPFISKIYLGKPKLIKELNDIKYLDVDHILVPINAIYVSTFHIVIIVDDINDKKISLLGEKIFLHPLLKKQCNITFCQLCSYHTIKTRTYERGVGFTSSCATGCAAGSYITYLLYSLSNEITVKQKYGDIKVSIDNGIYISGESNYEKDIILYE